MPQSALPQVPGVARAQWLERRTAELLPIPYFHLVFTLPQEIAALALQNKRLMYGLLFEAARATIAEVAANPRHLGAHEVGILAVLHTWGQNLMHHPHLHCVASGGGLSPDGQRWIASKSYYFLPVRVLSRVFRRKYCELLRQAYEQNQLEFHGQLAPLAERRAFQKLLAAATSREWVVYAKHRFASRCASSSTWPATPIAWRSPIVDSSATTPAASPSGTRIMRITDALAR